MPNIRISATQIYNETFWKFPKFLLTNDKYKDLTNDSRVAYMLIRDRMRYSLSNNWVNENGEVYIIYTVEQLRNDLGVGKNKVTRIKKQLEDTGLLEIEKQGFNPHTKKNEPDRYFICEPEYEFNNFKGSALEQSGIPKMGTREKSQNVDIPTPKNNESAKNTSSTLEQSGIPKMGTNKDKNTLDTIKDTNIDTNEWNFSSDNFTVEQVKAQDNDLRKNIGEVLSHDSTPMFLSEESINLISMWFNTPAEIHECMSIILNAKNDSLENAKNAGVESYINMDDEALRAKITRTLRRFFNKMRTAKSGEIKNPKNYLYGSMLNLFDRWQNDQLQSRKNN